MKKISFALLALLLCVASYAVPARPGFIKATQPDGSVIMIQKHGDEFFHWTTDASGQAVEKGEDGYWHPVSRETLNARRYAARMRRTARKAAHNSGTHIALGQKHFLVILVEFKDVKFASATAKDDFTNLLNQEGYGQNGGTGSARDYYYDNSGGIFEPLFDVFGPVTLTNDMSYYGGNNSSGDDKNPEQAIIDGCKGLDDEIDFTIYDNDNDGIVDLVFMYYAGYGEADSDETNAIWPHQWSLSEANKSLTLDGKKIDSYACTNEIEGTGVYAGKMCGIGTACHEFGHAMGLPDFYDTDYDTNGQAAAMFGFSTMDSGAYNNNGRTPPYFTVEERIILGWLPEDTIKEFTQSGTYILESVAGNIAYKTPTETSGEYFVYECRAENGWDAALGGHGLIVTHIDKSSRTVKINGGSSTAYNLWANWSDANSINENGSHPCCYVIPAADQSNLMFGYKYYSGYGYYYDATNDPKIPFPGSTKTKTYVAKSWNGVDSDITLSNIEYSNGRVSFYVSVPSPEIDYPVIANPENGTYSAGETFEFSLLETESRPVSAVQWYFDDEPVSATSVVLRAGVHTIEAVLTLSTGDTQTVTLEIVAE